MMELYQTKIEIILDKLDNNVFTEFTKLSELEIKKPYKVIKLDFMQTKYGNKVRDVT